MLTTEDLTLTALRKAYVEGRQTPTTVCQHLLDKIASSQGIFISSPRVSDVLERCKILESLPENKRGRLWGIPFAVKDNIDVEGEPTTCACPDFSRIAKASAPTVQAIIDAGGVFLGKTNMDQFACGLVGTRTPYGIPKNTFDDRFTPGGSSSGSAVAVAEGMVTFALGTDTAGSGRVPAGQNGIVGIKPSLGRFSTLGVVPACYLLDCVSIFALKVSDGTEIARLLENQNVSDPTWRPQNTELRNKSFVPKQKFKFSLPEQKFWKFDGPGGESVRLAMEEEMKRAIERLVNLGGEQVQIDFTPFAETAVLLYGGPFVAERYSGIRSFLEARAPDLEPPELADISIDQRMLKVTRSIISKTEHWGAADVFEAFQQLSQLKAEARTELSKIDILVVPTVAYNYTVREIVEEEDEQDYRDMLSGKAMLTKNANLGRFTNFVNLLDMCGISVPSGILEMEANCPEKHTHKKARKIKNNDKNSNGTLVSNESGKQSQTISPRDHFLEATGKRSVMLPFGVTLLGPAWTDDFVAGVASLYEEATGLGPGPIGHRVTPYQTTGKVRHGKPGM